MPSEDGSAAFSVDLVHFVKPNIVKAQKLQNNGDVISLVRKNASGAIRLGIDLNGGAEFLLKIANNVQIAISRTAVAQVIQPAADAADTTKAEVTKK